MEFAATRGVPSAETRCAFLMDHNDYQFLRDMAAECRERADRAQHDKDRVLWLELAEEIASRDPAWSKAISAKPN